MFIDKWDLNNELGLEAKVSKVRELIDICNLGIETTEKQIKELMERYDHNKAMLQMLDKKADELTKVYLNLNDQLNKLLKQTDLQELNEEEQILKAEAKLAAEEDEWWNAIK